MSKLMLIDATHQEETRVAVVSNGQIEDFDFEARNKRQLRGNIYLAKVTRVEPSLQAAFVDYGGNRHGFLAFSEIHPDYYQIPKEDRDALLREEAEHAAEHRHEVVGGRRPRGEPGPEVAVAFAGFETADGRVSDAHAPCEVGAGHADALADRADPSAVWDGERVPVRPHRLGALVDSPAGSASVRCDSALRHAFLPFSAL